MDTQIIDFYENKRVPVKTLIDARRSERLTPESVEAGAEDLFNRILQGLEITDQEIPREVWKLSHKYVSKQYKAGLRQRDHVKTLKRLGFLETLSTCLGWLSFWLLVGIGIWVIL